MYEHSRYVALISGIRVGDVNQNPLAFQLFVDYVMGNLGSIDEIEFACKQLKKGTEMTASISRLIIAGNSLVAPEKLPESSGLKHVRKVCMHSIVTC